MDSPNYHTFLLKIIENSLRSESDEIIQRKTKEFEENLKRARDRAVSETITNIRIISEENGADGRINISINYKG